MAKKGRDSKARRKARKLRIQEKHRKAMTGSIPRKRGFTFFGKSRSGDRAALDLEFSGIDVPFLEGEEPGKQLLERHEKVTEAMGSGLGETH